MPYLNFFILAFSLTVALVAPPVASASDALAFITRFPNVFSAPAEEKAPLDAPAVSAPRAPKVRSDLTPEEIEELKKNVERKQIMIRRNNWQLSEAYCFGRTYYENVPFCNIQLQAQNEACSEQITVGNNVYIDLKHQLLFAVKDCRLVVYTRVITGKNKTPSPTGHYKIYQRRGPHFMQGEWYVTMALYFRGGFALHDADTWRKGKNWLPEKRAIYGSHGCINITRSAMNTIWENFTVGDGVHIYYTLPPEIAAEIWQKVGTKSPIDPSTL